MSEIAQARINTFAKDDFVPTSEQLITLTYGQLQELIINAVTKAIEPLQDEVRDLKKTVACQNEKIAALEATQDTHADNQFIQLRLINEVREESHKEEIARTANTTQKTADNITRIAVILAAKEKRLIEGQAPRAYVDKLRKEGVTFSELANIMGLTVDRIRQLSRIAATDQRFNITWHPRKKNTKIIKLRRWDVLEF
jgi:DNA-directed RNA polymerase sigma subunit (sigma70/sigma32)